MICTKNINIALLKNFLGLELETFQKEDKIFIKAPISCTIEKNNEIIKIHLDKDYIISINDGDYYVLDYKYSKNFHRYIFFLNGEKGIFIFKKQLKNEEVLHFLLSIFFVEKIIKE
ncbi:hypothetical protein SU69_03430 [Thermosipho melanesiensis]|uniref:Uncharacterized protein n=2 Tax=Thermosipho melanesiensis TaxID=46541 RepID=A6LKS7_THEM4|nr:hypothetical protein [Thermosipho melanesiensis]ABR30528.1 hypothetical protein Tmel_0664 [Thermosipho melanesiensis BI429]APT73677.1 hypothetical protein BW47_03610 [Thermosipho melanesiensis]OOC35618.1 hypothetical protein SU68_03485 [Thermosipho melanesiensis]OOC39293.1 hypothetical protein SU69_03430 [Thermosipho melanesiensis]OOC39379.1 hypothetical protein SU70_03430 [Thermosipho melanesiensis]